MKMHMMKMFTIKFPVLDIMKLTIGLIDTLFLSFVLPKELPKWHI